MSAKQGFVYIWFDRKHKRYYVGSHWGSETDGYICSSTWMLRAYKRRPQDFKRRILARGYTKRSEMRDEEIRWISMIKKEEIRVRYYNLVVFVQNLWHYDEERRLTVGQKISEKKLGKSNGPHTEATKQLMSERKKGATFTDDHRAKLAAAQTGKKWTPEQRQARSDLLKAQYASGVRQPRKR